MKKFSLLIAVTLCVAILSVYAVGGNEIEIDNDITALENLKNMKIVEGYEDGELHPENTLTRAEFAKFLCNSFNHYLSPDAEAEFTDMDKSHWAYAYVLKAVDAGWLEGFPDKTFRPDENITYEQALSVMCRILSLVNSRAQYPVSYVSAAMDNSITDGVKAFIGDEINREQAARIILNSMHYCDMEMEDTNLYAGNIHMATSAPSMSGGRSGGGSVAAMDYSIAAKGDSSLALEDGAYYVEEPYYPNFNTEEYSAGDENVFKDPSTSPLSTFSIDTDTASYSNIRRFILNSQNIPTDAVRSEELINYFDYAKAEIKDGVPFGVKYTVAQCPWNSDNHLAMLTVSGEELKEKRPSNIVFLVDISGSMYSRNKLPLVKEALKMLLEKLDESDTISMVTYASGTGVALEPTPATEKEKIINAIDNLRAGGATAGASGINLAYELAERNIIDGNNRIILCTDGDFNVGQSSESELESLITQKRETGIYLSVLGFGMGNYKDNKMELLADKGNGNYAYIDNLREAKKVLVDDMSKTIYTIAKDVKLQVEFNPATVAKYRLIGYENRLLNNEDFDNDKKDAGELGAGATVTVLYEIVPGKAEASLKYQTMEASGSDELMNVKIRYKEPDADESKLMEIPVEYELMENPDEDFYFASAVAEFGMILSESEYVGSSTYETVQELAKKGLGEDPFGLRHEFVQLVDLLKYIDR